MKKYFVAFIFALLGLVACNRRDQSDSGKAGATPTTNPIKLLAKTDIKVDANSHSVYVAGERESVSSSCQLLYDKQSYPGIITKDSTFTIASINFLRLRDMTSKEFSEYLSATLGVTPSNSSLSVQEQKAAVEKDGGVRIDMGSGMFIVKIVSDSTTIHYDIFCTHKGPSGTAPGTNEEVLLLLNSGSLVPYSDK